MISLDFDGFSDFFVRIWKGNLIIFDFLKENWQRKDSVLMQNFRLQCELGILRDFQKGEKQICVGTMVRVFTGIVNSCQIYKRNNFLKPLNQKVIKNP